MMQARARSAPLPAPPTAEVTAAICADLVVGLDLRAACLAHGVGIEAMRRGLGSRSSAWLGVQSQVREAQVTVQREAAAHLERAAAAGAPSALAVMASRLSATPDRLEEPPSDPVEFIRWRLADVQRRIPGADGIAYNQLVKQEADLRAQLVAATADSGEGRTPAQVMAAETSHAREAADVHLQVYVVEYLRRHPGLFLASTAGRIEIVA